MPNKKHLVAFAAVSAILGSLVITTPSFAASSEQVLYSFCQTHIQGNCRDGETPVAGLIFDAAGNLYGTTYSGGYYGYGAVFELTLNNGTWAEKVLYSFNLDGKDGFNPNASLIFDAAGNLYGTTYSGGAYNEGGGTVFELIPNQGRQSRSFC